jgi:GSCFA family
MEFFTPFHIPKQTISIDYESSIFSIGSCFAENIGELLNQNKFNCLINPFGILFHPLAIERILIQIINQNKLSENELIYFNEQFLSLNCHSSLNKKSKEEFLENYNQKIIESNLFLKNATHIMITYGTSWVYEYLKTNEIIANCQKIPASEFKKKILEIEDIKKSMNNTIQILKEFNPNLQIIFTISPVRHLKDGFLENTLSKAHLITALYEKVNSMSKNYEVFPAYEIMLDELRDYRFYKNDYLHPNELAIQHIWEKFCNLYFLEKTKETLKIVQQINKDLKHKPFDESSKSHQKFIVQLQEKISNLAKEKLNIKFE